MGQTQSITENLIPETVDNLHLQVLKHTRVFSEIGSLTYEEFQKCLHELNDLSRKCLDNGGKQLLFLVKKGTDTSMLWKATVRIACVKVDPINRMIESHKLLNLKQFLCVFKTFQSHLSNLISSEKEKDRRLFCGTDDSIVQQHSDVTASILMNDIENLTSAGRCWTSSSSKATTPDDDDDSHDLDECSICLDRKTEVLLPCAHTFCCPCIEQWNVNNKTCPICCEVLASTDETWVMSEMPGVDEISDKICTELMNLSKK